MVTGASSGIGANAAERITAAGWDVAVVGRNPERTRAVAEKVGGTAFLADYDRLDDVRELAASITRRYERIDVLANNAGGIFGERTVTRDGFETTFQVNHLAGFLLTNLLRERLVESGAAVIQTSSEAARRFARFDVDDLQGERRYSAAAAYGNGKLANVLFTKELHRRYADAGLRAVSFHPGVIASGFAAASAGVMRWFYTSPLTQPLLTSTEIGGGRLTWLALGTPGVDWTPGEFYANNRVARTNRLAADPVLARKLWDRSAAMVGI